MTYVEKTSYFEVAPPCHTMLTNCCIVSLTPMSAGQTIATCVTSAIPHLVSLFSLDLHSLFEKFDEIND